jgi:antitoxin (DNA-binding transcriptional repressor) of toxin-antitoxin stability system
VTGALDPDRKDRPMDDDLLDLWRRSGYDPLLREVMAGLAVLVDDLGDVQARLNALDPETMPAEEAARVRHWLRTRLTPDPDLRQTPEWRNRVARLTSSCE